MEQSTAHETQLFSPTDGHDRSYSNCRDEKGELGKRARVFAEELWKMYFRYADANFLTEIRDNFGARFWEMYLTCTLLAYGKQSGYDVSCPKPGPDVLLSYEGQRIWVEAVTATPGDPALPDSLGEPSPVESYPERDARIVLRYRTAIDEKYRRYLKYCNKGIIADTDSYVIAVNGSLVPYYPQEIPRILKALFPLGVWKVVLDRRNREVVESGPEFRPSVPKASGQPVDTTVFLDDQYCGVAAVLYSDAHAWMPTDPLGRDFLLAHNPLATRPVPVGLLPSYREYVTNGCELQATDGICATKGNEAS